jgi:hypothetical protein
VTTGDGVAGIGFAQATRIIDPGKNTVGILQIKRSKCPVTGWLDAYQARSNSNRAAPWIAWK